MPKAIGAAESSEPTSVSPIFPGQLEGISPNANYLPYKSPWLLLGTIWLLGVAAMLTRIFFGWSRTTKLIDESAPALERIQIAATPFLNVSDKKHSSVHPEQIRLSDQVTGPCSAGWIRPVILLPSAWAATATERELQTVIAHEVSHIKGCDLFWDLLAKLCQACWWFHPVMWVLPKHHRLACEHISDVAAASICGDAAEYRRQLAAWAIQFNQMLLTAHATTISMAERTLLQKRLRWLQTETNTCPLSRGATLIAFVAWVLVTAVFSALSVVHAEPDLPKNAAITPESNTEVVLDKDGEPFNVQVRDQNGKPVKKAKVAISYIYKDQEDDERAAILDGHTQVDDLGELATTMPSRAINTSVQVIAEGFVDFHETIKPSTSSMVARLKEGRVIKVRAVDNDGVLMEKVWPILGGVHLHRQWERDFKSDGNGNFVSKTVRNERRWMRVVGITDGDALLFSDLIDSADESMADEDGIIQVKLSPGLKLKGRLDDAVPRPVKNGFVDLCIAEAEGHRIPGLQENQANRHPTGFIWREIVPVKEDGTFEAESLPPGGHLQLYALVDGFQSRLPSLDDINSYLNDNKAICDGGWQSEREADNRILPQLYPLRENDIDRVVSVIVPCTPTAELQVKVSLPSGEPFPNAKVTVCPNGRFLPNVNFVPGMSTNSPQIVQGFGPILVGEDLERTNWISQTLYHTLTNEDGGVTLSVPGNNPRETVSVKASGYEMPIHPSSSITGRPWRHDSVAIVPGETVQKSVVMEQKFK